MTTSPLWIILFYKFLTPANSTFTRDETHFLLPLPPCTSLSTLCDTREWWQNEAALNFHYCKSSSSSFSLCVCVSHFFASRCSFFLLLSMLSFTPISQSLYMLIWVPYCLSARTSNAPRQKTTSIYLLNRCKWVNLRIIKRVYWILCCCLFSALCIYFSWFSYTSWVAPLMLLRGWRKSRHAKLISATAAACRVYCSADFWWCTQCGTTKEEEKRMTKNEKLDNLNIDKCLLCVCVCVFAVHGNVYCERRRPKVIVFFAAHSGIIFGMEIKRHD